MLLLEVKELERCSNKGLLGLLQYIGLSAFWLWKLGFLSLFRLQIKTSLVSQGTQGYNSGTGALQVRKEVLLQNTLFSKTSTLFVETVRSPFQTFIE